MNVKVGSCPDSWGVWFGEDPKQIPWRRFLDEVAEAGYEWIELGPYGYFPQDLNVLRRQLSRRNLKATGTFSWLISKTRKLGRGWSRSYWKSGSCWRDWTRDFWS